MDKNSIRFDLLKELNNIGSGSAITSLSQLVTEKIDLHVPTIKLYNVNEVSEVINKADELVFGVLAHLEGDIVGTMMYIMDMHSANTLVSSILKVPVDDDISSFDDMQLSALTEVGNIMFSSYVSILTTMTSKNVKMSTPFVAMDMAAAILSVPAIEFGKISDNVIFVEQAFELHGETVTGYLVMVPDVKSYNVIANSMGVGV